MHSAKPLLKFKKLTDKAILPTKGSPLAAGYDLYSAVDISVPAKGKSLVPTNLSVAVPEGNYGRIAPRSGLAWKNFIDSGAGVVDADYRGEGILAF
jgi:dUTP pyrophosphatase